MQESNGRDLPVEFFSKKLNATQHKYSVHEKEMLAIVKAVAKWKHLLFGMQIVVYTDHKPLIHLLEQKSLSNKQYRWLSEISPFDITIDYIEGTKNVIADVLSRSLVNHSELHIESSFEQRIRTLWSEMTNDKKEEYTERYNARWINEVLMTEEGQIIIPDNKELRQEILREAHEPSYMGHLGSAKTFHRVSSCFKWTGMIQDIKNYCTTCKICQQTKHSNRKPIGLLHPIEVPNHPWEEIQIDFLALPKDEETGFDNLLVVCDRLSKRVRLFPCHKTINTKETAELIMTNVIKVHGFPKRIISDRDKRFTSEIWKEITTSLGIKSSLSSAFHPQTNGLVERINRTIIQILRGICLEAGRNWPTAISAVEMAYNSCIQESLGSSPMEIDCGRSFRFPLSFMKEREQLKFQDRLNEAKDKLTKASDKQKHFNDRNKCNHYISVNTNIIELNKTHHI